MKNYIAFSASTAGPSNAEAWTNSDGITVQFWLWDDDGPTGNISMKIDVAAAESLLMTLARAIADRRGS